MKLTLELFVSDLARSRRFYGEILGFKTVQTESSGYTRLESGNATIALNDVQRIPKSHPSRQDPGERVGKGIEIGLLVEDIEIVYQQVQSAGVDIAEKLKSRPWGARDFCLHDPDGNYLRISSK